MPSNGVPYDTQAGILKSAWGFKSTVLPLVMFDGFEFWILSFFNIMVCALRHLNVYNPHDYHLDLPWHLTGATGSLMTFFVVFYNRHVFERYNVLYDLTKGMEELCLEIASALRVQVTNREAQRKIAKLVLVSCLMFYYERTGGGSDQKQGEGQAEDKEEENKVSKHEFNQLQKLGLIDKFEKRSLQQFCERNKKNHAIPSFLLLQWCSLILRRTTEEPDSRDDLVIGFDERFSELRTTMAQVTQIMDLPMPFQYFHIMNMMLVLNLVLWAYALGCQNSYFAPAIYMFVQMMFQGVRELSTALSDPFGDDEVDFDINTWMKTLYVRMYAILEDPFEIQDMTIDGNKPLKDPDSNSRKINLLVDRGDNILKAQDAEKRKRVKKHRSCEHPWASHAVPPGESMFQLHQELEARRPIWESERARKASPTNLIESNAT